MHYNKACEWSAPLILKLFSPFDAEVQLKCMSLHFDLKKRNISKHTNLLCVINSSSPSSFSQTLYFDDVQNQNGGQAMVWQNVCYQEPDKESAKTTFSLKHC